jgi:hypothetical protein
MSGDPNVLYDGNHLDVLRRHVRDESIDLVYGRQLGSVVAGSDAAGRSRRRFVS